MNDKSTELYCSHAQSERWQRLDCAMLFSIIIITVLCVIIRSVGLDDTWHPAILPFLMLFFPVLRGLIAPAGKAADYRTLGQAIK